MKVLIACEFSGMVRDAFRAKGHDAWSCDIIPTERKGPHIVNDVRNVLDDGWDMMIAHPPCTHLSYQGLRWFKTDPDRMRRAREDFEFFMRCIEAPIPMIAVENPRGFTWQWYQHPDQVIEPSEFGHHVTKATCLWLKDLPPLMATLIDPDPETRWSSHGKFSHTAKNRSRTFPGIALAMAEQWGSNTFAASLREAISQVQAAAADLEGASS